VNVGLFHIDKIKVFEYVYKLVSFFTHYQLVLIEPHLNLYT